MAVHPVPLRTFPDYQSRALAAAPLFRGIGTLEKVVAAVTLLAASPILLVCATVIATLSGLSPFIAHRRVGRYGRTIWVLKLRTMWKDHSVLGRARFVERIHSDAPAPEVPKRAPDPRVTNCFAAFCRRHSLDELPQLWNVLRGDMALVGPRPLTQQEIELHYRADAAELLQEKPGITGLWQVRGRSRLTYRQRRKLDLFLLRKCTLTMYCYVLWASAISVVSGENAW